MICTASVEDRVPPFLRNTGKGWVTAEYGMLPRATSTRMQREASAGKVGGRTQEIQRLIGRSLRSVTNLPALGERTIWIDCDVIQADGGTRTASITGAFVALALALEKLRERDVIRTIPLSDYVAATSVGIVDGEPLLDLAYDDDSRADVDMNVVKTGDGRFIEVQGTAEAHPVRPRRADDAARSRRSRHPAAGREAARHRRAPGGAITPQFTIYNSKFPEAAWHVARRATLQVVALCEACLCTRALCKFCLVNCKLR